MRDFESKIAYEISFRKIDDLEVILQKKDNEIEQIKQ